VHGFGFGKFETKTITFERLAKNNIGTQKGVPVRSDYHGTLDNLRITGRDFSNFLVLPIQNLKAVRVV
jgi:hypothetical protein